MNMVADLIEVGTFNLSLYEGQPCRLTVYSPPRYLIARARDSTDWEVHQQRPDGHWQPWGFDHPCPSITAHDGRSWIFSSPHHWVAIHETGWTPLEQRLRFTVTHQGQSPRSPNSTPIEVPLRLVPERTTSQARLWLFAKAEQDLFERWVADISPSQLEGLEFGLFDDNEQPFIALLADRS